VSASAAKTSDGTVVIGLANLDPHRSAPISAAIAGIRGGQVTGEILTADVMDAHNTFESPNTVHPVAFEGATLRGNKLVTKLPPMSVVVLTIQ
jgi:alpha-N-arabinofuranosidase